MYYHASDTKDINVLEPRGEDGLVYFSTKRENTLVYLVNAVKKYCRETGIQFEGAHWGPYGFTKDGRLELEEYYPNALEKTYRGESAYIYMVEHIENVTACAHIENVVTSSSSVNVTAVEFVPDALAAIYEAERQGLIAVKRYDELAEGEREWLAQVVRDEYLDPKTTADYKAFLKANFVDCLKDLVQVDE